MGHHLARKLKPTEWVYTYYVSITAVVTVLIFV